MENKVNQHQGVAAGTASSFTTPAKKPQPVQAKSATSAKQSKSLSLSLSQSQTQSNSQSQSLSSRPSTATTQSCRKADRTPFSALSACSSVSSMSLSVSDSVSDSLSLSTTARDAAKSAKLASTMDRIQKVQQLKEKWAQEKEKKSSLYKERRQLELQKLAETNAVAAEARRKHLEKQREVEIKEKQQKVDELATSLQARAQLAMDLEKQAKAKRRISMFLNTQMRKKAVEKESQLAAQKKQEEIELLSSRRLDFLELREAKKEDEARRRDSMHNRVVMGQEERQRLDELEKKLQQEEKSLLEMRQSNWQDDHNIKAEQDRARRESLINRGEEWKNQQEIVRSLEKQQEEEELNLLKKREQDWKDVQRYKQQQEKSRRESLAGRLDKWREQKSIENKQTQDAALVESMEHELKHQALEDVHNYQSSIKESRRQSLAYRLDKAKKDKDFDLGQQTLQQMVNEELRQIDEQDRQDVNNYRQRILDARRQSLDYRNQIEYQERMRLEGEKQSQRLAESADREIREAAWADVKKYREQQRAASRHSLAWRLADAHRQKEIELSEHQTNLSKLHLDLECKRANWLSLQEYNRDEQERRRKSVAMRLESWRIQKMATIREQERKDMIAEEDAMYREMDREELLALKATQELEKRTDLLSSSGMVF